MKKHPDLESVKNFLSGNVQVLVDGALANICRSGGTLGARDFSCAVSCQLTSAEKEDLSACGLHRSIQARKKTASNQGIVAETINKITMLTFMVKKEK